MSKPAISVLTPVYNTGAYVRETVQSILNQTFADFEFIIIDDGSKDDSADILRSLAAQDRRIRFISRPNRGLVDTRNELLNAARGDLIAWADSDDRYAHTRLEKQFKAFQKDPQLVAVGSRWEMVDSGGMPIRTFGFPEDNATIQKMLIELDNMLWFPTVMMRRQAAIDVGGFRHPFVIAEDYDLHLRLSEIGHMANLPDRLCFYRQHFASTVNSKHWQAKTYSKLARDLAIERRSPTGNGTDRLQRGETIELEFENALSHDANIEHLRTRWVWMALHEGNLDTARKHAALLAWERPLQRSSWKLLACAIRGW